MFRSTISEIGREVAALAEFHPTRPLDLKIQGKARRFLVGRMGSTGSTWLAKLLNSHAEVYCSHEQILSQIYPRDQYGADEVTGFLQCFAWDMKHDAYRAIGDVGSTWSTYLPHVPVTTALLVRHPAKMLNTWLHVHSNNQSYTRPMSDAVRASIKRIWGIDAARYERLDRDFILHAFCYVCQLSVLPDIDLLIRIEDMNRQAHVHHVLTTLTGECYDAGAVENLLQARVNQRATPVCVRDIVANFSSLQREWYKTIIGNAAEILGYELLDEAAA